MDDLHVGPHGHDAPTSIAKSAILRAQSHGFLTNIMTSTHRLNIDALPDLMDWAERQGVSVRSVPLSPIGRGDVAPFNWPALTVSRVCSKFA